MKTFGKRIVAILTILIMAAMQMPKTAEAEQMSEFVEAKQKMMLNRNSVNLYLNGGCDGNNSFNLNIKNKQTNFKSKYSTDWSIEDESIASVAKNGVVTAKKVGSTIVTCLIKKKSTQNVISNLKATIIVNANAKTVTINNAPENHSLKVGETFDFNRTMVAENGGKATDKTEWIVSDETIASVDRNGVVTTLREGTFTIQAKTYQTKDLKEQGIYTAKSEKVTIHVVNNIAEVTALKQDQLAITFSGSLKGLTKDDFLIKDANTGAGLLVTSVEASDDASVYTVDLAADMTNGTTYEVTVSQLTRNFVFIKGTPASIRLEPQFITAGQAVPIAFQVLDANGLDLTDGEIGKCTMTASCGTVNGLLLTLPEDETASVQITYTDKSDPQNSRSFSSEKVSVAGAAEAEYKVLAATIDRVNSALVSFAEPNMTVSAGAEGKMLYVKVEDDKENTYIANDGGECKVSFSSETPEVLTVTEDGRLTALTPGTGSIKIRGLSGSLEETVSVTVRKASVDTKLICKPDPLKGSLTNATGENVRHERNNITFCVQILDQYGEPVPAGTRDITLSMRSTDKPIVTYQGQSLSDSSRPVTVKNGDILSLQPVQEGFWGVTLACGTLSYTVPITVTAANNVVAAWKIYGTKTLNIAAVYGESAPEESSAVFTLDSVNKEGQFIDRLSFTGDTYLKITGPDGSELSIPPTDNEYRLTADILKGLQTGTYTMLAYYSGHPVDTVNFSVIDTSEAPVVSIKTDEIKNTRITLSSVAKCLSIPAGFSLTGFQFTSTEEGAVRNVPGFVAEVPVSEEYTGNSFPLTVTQVLLTRRSSGRTYPLSVMKDITISSPVKEPITPLQKLSYFVDDVEDYILSDKTTASAKVFTEALDAAKLIIFEIGEAGYPEADHAAELEDAYTALKAAKENLQTANVTVALFANPAEACDLNGDGKYQSGDLIELSAFVREGYVFDGWYQDGTKFSDDVSFSFTAGTGTASISYEARFTKYTDQKLTVEIEGNGSVTCEAQEVETEITERKELLFTAGTYVTLTANVSLNEVFFYWLDESSNKVLHMGPAYSFYLTDARNIKACYGRTVSNKYNVIFKDINGKVLSSAEVAEGEAAVAPSNLGTFAGFTFVGWDADFSHVTRDMVITAKYKATEGYTVSVTNGVIQNEKTDYSYGDAVTVQAEDAGEGLTFIGWYQNNEKRSTSTEYTFYLVEQSTSVEARYEAQTETASEPLFSFSMSGRTTLESGKQTVRLNTVWNVPEGFSLMETGFVYLLNEGSLTDETKLSAENAGIDGVKKCSPSTLSEDGTYAFTMTLSTASKSKNLYAKGFLSYRDDVTGKIITKYTDLKTSSAE